MFSLPVGLALASDARLTARMFRVLLAVYARLEASGEASPSNEQLAAATGMDPRHVRRTLAELQALGALAVRAEGARRLLRPTAGAVAVGEGPPGPPLGGDGGANSARGGPTRPGADSALPPGPDLDDAPGPSRPPDDSDFPGEDHAMVIDEGGRIGPPPSRGDGGEAGADPAPPGPDRPGAGTTIASPPRVSPPTPPSSRPPVCVSGGVRAREGATPGGRDQAADAGPAHADTPADAPAVPDHGADGRIARLGGETLDGGVATAIGTPGQPEGPEAQQAREELREWVARFCPQLHHRLSEWLGTGYSPELIRYAIQQALDCNKTASIRWIRGILENKTREGWIPLPAAIAAPAADAPGAAMPRQGAIAAAPLSRNAARQRDALERWRRFRADQQPDAPEETAP